MFLALSFVFELQPQSPTVEMLKLVAAWALWMELHRALPEKIEPNRINDNIGFESFAKSFRLMKKALQHFAIRVKIEYYS